MILSSLSGTDTDELLADLDPFYDFSASYLELQAAAPQGEVGLTRVEYGCRHFSLYREKNMTATMMIVMIGPKLVVPY